MSSGWKLLVSKFFFIPQRYILGIMGCFAMVNAYLMRIILSVAIIEMVRPVNQTINEAILQGDTCPASDVSDSVQLSAVKSDHFYDWSETTQGLILSSFYWGYVLTHLPGGILVEKFGGKYTLGLGILSTAIFTILTPVVVKAGDWPWLIVLRIAVGVGEGTTYPAINGLLAKWTPLSERSMLGTLVFSGAQMGTVIGDAASGAIISATQTWESVFYVFGGIGIAWFIFWVIFCYSTPQTHPFISDKEKTYLETELAKVSPSSHNIPWKGMLTSKPLWALVAAQVGHDWGFFTMVTDLPKYMKSILKFNVAQSGIWSSLPFLVMWIVAMSSAALCDWLIRKLYFRVTFARKFFTTVASIGPGVFIVGASYVGCDRTATVVLFTVAMGFMGMFYCGMKVNSLDLSPNFAGALMAIVNGLGAVSGIITPYLAGALTEDQTLSQWRIVFWITLGVFIITTGIFILYGSGEEQWWNAVDSQKTSESTVEYNSKNQNQV